MHADLDIQLLLETKYDYVKKLRQSQAEMEISGTIVIDQLTIARNHVLVNAESIGGAQEKYIPPWTLNENNPTILASMPLFAGTVPLPEEYIRRITYGGTTNSKTGLKTRSMRFFLSFLKLFLV